MNHIEFYERTINDLSINFEVRHYMKQFYPLDLQLANEAIEAISRLLRLKQIDLEVLKKLERHEIEHA